MFLELVLQIDFVCIFVAAIMAHVDQEILDHRNTEFLDLNIVFILRNARLFTYLDVVRDAKFVSETIKYLTKPILTKFFFCYIIFYEYAYMGQLMFGGRISYDVYKEKLAGSYPAFYYLMNFNDFGSSLIVLFQQMVVNNWWVVVDM